MLYIVGWSKLCIYKIIRNAFSVGFLLYSMAHNIYRKQCSWGAY